MGKVGGWVGLLTKVLFYLGSGSGETFRLEQIKETVLQVPEARQQPGRVPGGCPTLKHCRLICFPRRFRAFRDRELKQRLLQGRPTVRGFTVVSHPSENPQTNKGQEPAQPNWSALL